MYCVFSYYLYLTSLTDWERDEDLSLEKQTSASMLHPRPTPTTHQLPNYLKNCGLWPQANRYGHEREENTEGWDSDYVKWQTDHAWLPWFSVMPKRKVDELRVNTRVWHKCCKPCLRVYTETWLKHVLFISHRVEMLQRPELQTVCTDSCNTLQKRLVLLLVILTNASLKLSYLDLSNMWTVRLAATEFSKAQAKPPLLNSDYNVVYAIPQVKTVHVWDNYGTETSERLLFLYRLESLSQLGLRRGNRHHYIKLNSAKAMS